MTITSIIDALRQEATGDERDGVWEEGYLDALHDVEQAIGDRPSALDRIDPWPMRQEGSIEGPPTPRSGLPSPTPRR